MAKNALLASIPSENNSALINSQIQKFNQKMWIIGFQAGATMIVSGSAVVNSENPKETITYMRDIVNQAIQKTPA